VNGSNLVRKEMTTADDKMGDLQSDETFFLGGEFPLPWVVTPGLTDTIYPSGSGSGFNCIVFYLNLLCGSEGMTGQSKL
jgi:hypothetical protein